MFFEELLHDIYEYQNEGLLCICGDFNARCRNTADYIEGIDAIQPRTVIDHFENDYGDHLAYFLIKSNICMLNGRLGDDGQYTCVSQKGKSVVDYACVPYEQVHFWEKFNVHLMSNVINMHGVSHPENIPDHSLLTWNLSVPNILQSEHYPTASKKWYNLKDIPQAYMNADNPDVISQINLIENKLSDRNKLDEAYNVFQQFIEAEMDAHLEHKVINQNGRHKSKAKPYWNANLQELWNIAVEKDKLWLSFKGSCEHRTVLKQHFCKARKAFDKSLRKSKRLYQQQEQHHLLELSQQNQADFWQKFERIGIASERRSFLPTEVKDKSGTIIQGKDAVLEEWKLAFQNIYSDWHKINDYNDHHLEQIIASNNNHNDLQGVLSPLNEPITKGEVKQSILRAKLKKAAGVDNIKAEVLKNYICIEIIHKICNHCFLSGEVPSAWNQSIISPIPKDSSKDSLNPNNYRGIALISVPCKIYCDILNHRISKWLEDNHKLGDEQNGYRKDRNCIDHLYVLNDILNRRIDSKQNTFISFIDMRKAFDNVNHECLWYKPRKCGIGGHMFKAIQSLYDNVSYAVKVNGHLTSWFNISKGVKQGCAISPTLFKIYINDLIEEINNSNCGVPVGEKNLGILLFADDIAVIARNEKDLQHMLDIIDNWCKKWRLCINPEISKLVQFRFKGKLQSKFDFKCGKHKIEYEEQYKYLGMWLQENLSYDYSVKQLTTSAARALGALTAKFYQCGGMDYAVFTKLYNSLVVPVFTYASSIWGLNKFKCVNVIQQRAAKIFLGLNKTAPNNAAIGDIGWTTCYARQLGEVYRMQWRLSKMDDARITRVVHKWSKRSPKSIEQKAHNIFCKNDIACNFSGIESKHILKKKVKEIIEKINESEENKWLQGLWNDTKNCDNGNKLRLYRLYKERVSPEQYILTNMPRYYRQSLARLRSGTLPIRIETGRFEKIPLNERVCVFCHKHQIEDEKHFLLDCDFYNDLRFDLFQHMCILDNDFMNLPSLAKLCMIMTTESVQFILAKCIYLMFQRRKLHDQL
jgi:hypothetical protein